MKSATVDDLPIGASRRPGFLVLGVGVVLLGATLLILRANLPRWLFGTPFEVDEGWTVVAFLSYVLLGFTALACIAAIDRLSRARPSIPLWLRLAGGSLLIVAAIGVVLHAAVPEIATAVVGRAPRSLYGYWIMSSVLSVAVHACLLLQRAAQEQRNQALQLQLDQDALERDLARAELAVLEARIEPHFLFNTLAHIKREYRRDTAAADEMLAALIDYLERASPALRSSAWTLGDELDLIQVYFDILARRFGDRMQFEIDATAHDRGARMPALTVATLVENAIRHGLTPKAEGGIVRVTVRRDGPEPNSLSIEVRDDGVGLRQTSGTGLGLATVRARLRGAFGSAASLLVEPAEPGVRALLRIPAK